MKKLFITILILSIAVCSIVAFDSEWLTEIEIQNDTGEEIFYLFITPSESENWGADILGYTESFYDGDSLKFNTYYPEESQSFDIRAITVSGETYEYYGFIVSDGSKKNRFRIDSSSWNSTDDIDFYYDSFQTLSIDNETDYELSSLFIAPGDSIAYGIDFLSLNGSLYPGERFSVYLLMKRSILEYQIMAVDIDDDTYSFDLNVNPKYDENLTAIESSDLD